ncbi:hypothetical protein, partial [Staphylococcus aureus]|uniref:hypothetical protein n=1 Tax=Staphylococcus aureus TaxID=1280 RepID=UPI0019459D59
LLIWCKLLKNNINLGLKNELIIEFAKLKFVVSKYTTQINAFLKIFRPQKNSLSLLKIITS